MKVEFIKPRLVGARFDEHTIPLDVVRDLAVYEELIMELAKHLYKSEHPERQRVPKGFGSDFQLHLERVDEGSARPLLSLVTAGALALGVDAQPYFERARDLVTECIAARDDQLPDAFPKELFSYFNRFGRSLKEGESLELPRIDPLASPATLTPEKRKKLVLAAEKFYEKDIVLNGMIEEADFKAMTFRLRLLDGNHAIIPIPDHFPDQARTWNGRPRHLVTIQGVGSFDPWEKLQKVVTVETLSTQMNYEIANRIEEISELRDGWFNGGGVVPASEKLDLVAFHLISNYPEKLPLPAIIPTPDGNLLLEWNTSGDPSVDLRLDRMVGEFHSFDPQGQDLERDFPLENEENWKAFFHFLERTITPTPA